MKQTLQDTARRIRLHFPEKAHRARSPHLGSCLSCVDVLTVLYFQILRIDPDRPKSPDRNYFLLCKGYSAMALHATLAERGLIDPRLPEGYMQENGTMPAHPDRFSQNLFEKIANGYRPI